MGSARVAEDQGPGGAGLHARRLDLTVEDRAALDPRLFAARRMRCTQNVHFSISPTLRTVTSGLSCCSRGASNSGPKKLKTRTLYGQLWPQ